MLSFVKSSLKQTLSVSLTHGSGTIASQDIQIVHSLQNKLKILIPRQLGRKRSLLLCCSINAPVLCVMWCSIFVQLKSGGRACLTDEYMLRKFY